MTIKSSGSLSLTEINNEFGLGRRLGAYRGVRWYIDNSITTGTFSNFNLNMSDFYGKSATDPAPSGSTNYYSPGVFSFTVPLFRNLLTVKVQGAGGGGGGGYSGSGSAGELSKAFFPGQPTGFGGGGGSPAPGINTQGSPGSAGSASGGNYNNTNGGNGNQFTGGNGGSGGPGGTNFLSLNASGTSGILGGGGGGGQNDDGVGNVWRGGGAGGGGYVESRYTAGSLTTGTSYTIIVGSGGAGGVATFGGNGGRGGDGFVTIEWY